MNILAIDNSTFYFSVALKTKNNFAQYIIKQQGAAEKFGTVVDRLLADCGLKFSDIDCFAMGTGPGSFTGLRIALSIIKGFAIATNKPCIGIPSYQAIAAQYATSDKPCAVVFDAKKDMVYAAVYRKEGDQVIRMCEENLFVLEEFLNDRCNDDYLYLGESTNFEDRILEVYPFAPILSTVTLPEARFVASEAERIFDSLDSYDVDNIKLLYLHPDTCNVRK